MSFVKSIYIQYRLRESYATWHLINAIGELKKKGEKAKEAIGALHNKDDARIKQSNTLNARDGKAHMHLHSSEEQHWHSTQDSEAHAYIQFPACSTSLQHHH
jgi:hypothetical protein